LQKYNRPVLIVGVLLTGEHFAVFVSFQLRQINAVKVQKRQEIPTGNVKCDWLKCQLKYTTVREKSYFRWT